MEDNDSWMRIKQVAEFRRDARARDLVQAVQRRKEAQQKLELLLDYRLDYHARLESAVRMGIRGEGLLNYQRFLTNLERAVEQQTNLMTSLSAEVHAAQKKVGVEHRKRESYGVLDTRRLAEAEKTDRRRQQALQDEMATRSRFNFAGGD